MRARCKKCGEAFVVDPPPLIGARNESSVLFSLEALRASLPDAAKPAMATATAPSSPADDIMNLTGGGPFAATFAARIEETAPASHRSARLWIVASGAISLGMIVAAVAIGVTIARAPRSDGPVAASAPGPVVTAPVVTAAPPTIQSAPAPVASASSSARAVTGRRAAPTSARTAQSAPSATTTAAPAAARTTKCCAGESEFACHMRLSVGASCVIPSGDAAAR